MWTLDLDGIHLSTVRNHLRNSGIPESGVNTIEANAAKTLSECPYPLSSESKSTTGIVIGKVQSGKTSNFISLIGLAFDNGYDISILFGGRKQTLVDQNYKRLEQYFNGDKNVIVINAHQGRTLDNPCFHEMISMMLKNGRKIVIVCLKDKHNIEKLNDNLLSSYEIKSRPILIVDDEGDEGSLNTKVHECDESAIYSSIDKMRKLLKLHAFISVTATPQANLLIHLYDQLSPDFATLVEPGEGYCGLDVFHSTYDYVVEVSDSEELTEGEGIPNSLVKALAMFFVACAINNYRQEKRTKSSMLIHPSRLQSHHKIAEAKIRNLIKQWVEFGDNKHDVAYGELVKLLRAEYDIYAAAGVENLPPFELIEDEIVQIINMSMVHVLNSENRDMGLDESVLSKGFDYNIYIGGDMLGRGLTIDGLVITYLTRATKGDSNVDTLEQRARWFGYKTSYLDLCRIYAPEKTIIEFNNIRKHEDDLWNSLENDQRSDIPLKDSIRAFIVPKGLNPTRKNVYSATVTSFPAWSRQKWFVDDPESIKNNIRCINDFRETYSNRIKTKTFENRAPFRILENMKFSEVKKSILDNYRYDKRETHLNKPILNKLNSLFEELKIDPSIDVIWMRDAGVGYSKIDIKENGHMEYSVGPSNGYKGDNNEFVKVSTMQLQIHMIQDSSNTEVISPAISLYIPPEIRNEIPRIIQSC